MRKLIALLIVALMAAILVASAGVASAQVVCGEGTNDVNCDGIVDGGGGNEPMNEPVVDDVVFIRAGCPFEANFSNLCPRIPVVVVRFPGFPPQFFPFFPSGLFS